MATKTGTRDVAFTPKAQKCQVSADFAFNFSCLVVKLFTKSGEIVCLFPCYNYALPKVAYPSKSFTNRFSFQLQGGRALTTAKFSHKDILAWPN